MNFPNEEILYRVKEGDAEAFSKLYTHFRSPALKFCATLLKDEEEAENIIQEVFARIWDRRLQIKPEQSFQAYLFVSLRNQIFDEFRKIEKDGQLRKQYADRIAVINEEEGNDKEVKIKFILGALESLPERRKQILKLNIQEGKSYKEIAGFMNISTNTVKNQLIKAKEVLRRQFDTAAL
jgi:RNA polymerase sigma-70 factor (family 1)